MLPLRLGLCLGLTASLSALARAQSASEPRAPREAYLVAGAGVAGVFDSSRVGTGFAEYRFSASWKGIQPWISATVGAHGKFYLAAGGLYSIDLDRNWRVTLSFGPGFYHSRDNFDLGSELEFLSTAELSRKLPWGDRVGLSFGHISNGGVAEVNPGSEILKLSYQLRWPDKKRSRAP
jgi:hypothetical protein